MTEIIAAKVQGIENDLRTTLEYLKVYNFGREASNELIQIYERILNTQLSAERLQKAKDLGRSAETVVQFEEIYKKEINKKLQDVKKTKKYKEFVDTANRILNDGRTAVDSASAQNLEDDINVEPQIDECIDPWSKQPAQNPVKNIVCGHRYDKSSVEGRLLRERNLKCPYTGCANRQLIRKENLIEDINFKFQLESMRRERQSDQTDY